MVLNSRRSSERRDGLLPSPRSGNVHPLRRDRGCFVDSINLHTVPGIKPGIKPGIIMLEVALKDLLSESRSIYYTTESKADLAGSNAERQVDLLLKASSVRPSLQETSHNWKDILVIGELKKSEGEIRTKKTLLQMSCYVREVFIAQPTRRFVHAFVVCGTKMETWVFDRSGPYSSGIIDVYDNSKQFFQVLVGYTMMSDEELGLDTFITRNENGSKSITIKEFRGSEEMVLQLDIHRKSSSRKRKFSGKVMKASKRLRSANQQSRDTQGNELTLSIESVNQPSLFDRNDMDLYDNQVGSGRSGAQHRTGTMEFMAIEVLLNIDHTYRHDLESFFYVLIWQCVRRGWEKLDKLQRQGQPEESALRDWDL
ncbi:predicted protein [Histoplasma mississippiense (nom. inval.)]|uniref:predicted protein n=1 Tax=Ajellomyces capsulatus (strain NAm1 / WU24) TaxID=2059318 RepID=UPI000157C2D7|nr:predicted protein [Histoplasma mississippiense (nom. inval.)]EDN07437.1 predicted protein [Histoplasma mississippiense (nom. inval.)]